MEPRFDSHKIADVQRAKGVAEIYSQEDRMDMGVLRRAPSRAKQYVGAVVVLVLLIGVSLAWLGFNLFSAQAGFKKENVTLRIAAPSTVASGDTVTYRVEYANTDHNPVTDAVVRVEYPSDFTVTETSPSAANESKTEWNIGVLKGGDTGVIEIRGRLTGQNATPKILKAQLRYQPIKLTAEFTVDQLFTTTIDSSVLQASISGPNQISEGEQVEYQISYKDFSQVTGKENIQLRIKYPDALVFASADPMPDAGQDVWKSETLLKKLNGNTTGTIVLKAVATNKTTAEAPLLVQMGFFEGDSFRMEQETTIAVQVVRGDLLVDLKVNGSDDNGTVRFGDALTHTVSYENKGNLDLNNVTIAVTVKGKVVDWAKLKDSNGGAYSGERVEWSGSQVPALRTVRPGDKGELTFSVPLYEASELQSLKLSGALSQDLSIESSAGATLAAEAVSPDGKNAPRELKSRTIRQSVITNLSFDQAVRYFADDGASVGTGLLPPKVGQATTYRVYWRLSNTLHNLKDVSVETKLPAGVVWGNQASVPIGDIRYDEKTRIAVWYISELPARLERYDGYFDISLTPAATDANKIMVIAGPATVSAKDAVNGGQVSIRKDGATTNLDGDTVGRGKGLVTQ